MAARNSPEWSQIQPGNVWSSFKVESLCFIKAGQINFFTGSGGEGEFLLV